jgi:GxxExxY protein
MEKKNFFDGIQEIRDPQTYGIIGAAMEVHRELGRGFLEACYHEALCMELSERGIPFQPEVDLFISYKGRELKCAYRADLICFDNVVVEIKALAQITGVERAQLINYLKATGFRVGLILNFGAESLQFERVVFG